MCPGFDCAKLGTLNSARRRKPPQQKLKGINTGRREEGCHVRARIILALRAATARQATTAEEEAQRRLMSAYAAMPAITTTSAFAHDSGRLRTNEGDDAKRVVKTEYHHHQYPLVPEASLASTVKMPMESQCSSNQEEPHTERESEQVAREAEGTLATITPAAAAVEEERSHAWHAAEAIARLFKRTKYAKETFIEFAHALREIGNGYCIGEELFVTAFIAGVGDEFTAALLRVVAPQTLSRAAQEASRLRDTDGAQKSKRAKKSRHQRERGRKHNDSSGSLVETIMSKKPATLRSRDDASPLRKVETAPPLKPAVKDVKLGEDDGSVDSLSKKKRRTACFECEEVGHFRRECPQRARRL